MSAAYKIINNEKEMRFEIHEGAEIAYLEYRFYKKDIAFMHTLVPESMRGSGVAMALAAYENDGQTFNYTNSSDQNCLLLVILY